MLYFWWCFQSGAVVVVYIGTVCGGWSDHTASVLTRLSVPIWLVAAAALSGTVYVFFYIVFFILCVCTCCICASFMYLFMLQ